MRGLILINKINLFQRLMVLLFQIYKSEEAKVVQGSFGTNCWLINYLKVEQSIRVIPSTW